MYLSDNDLKGIISDHKVLYRSMAAVSAGVVGVQDVIENVEKCRGSILKIRDKYASLLSSVPAWGTEINELVCVFDSVLKSSKYDGDAYSTLVLKFAKFVVGSQEEWINIKSGRFNTVVDALFSELLDLKELLSKDSTASCRKEWLDRVVSMVSNSIVVEICRCLNSDIEFIYGIFNNSVSLAKENGNAASYRAVYSSLGMLTFEMRDMYDTYER